MEARVARWHIFQTKNHDLDKFWRVKQFKMLVYFMDIWSILRLFGTFCKRLVYFMVICYSFCYGFGMLYQYNLANLMEATVDHFHRR
jgi:hypothetical protein